MKAVSISPEKERRRDGERLIATLPFQFYNFNQSQLCRLLHGVTRNLSLAGACFHTTQRNKPGNILFMCSHAEKQGARGRRGTTRLAEIRWCAPLKDGKWSIGVRFL